MNRVHALLVWLFLLPLGCGGAAPCESDAQCPEGVCESKRCVAPARVDGGRDAGSTADAGVDDAGAPDSGAACVPGDECRAPAGACDVSEVCAPDGTCPADSRLAMGTTCRVVAGGCDVAEACDGVSAACPADTFAPASLRCRVAAGPCDLDDFCPGDAAGCVDQLLTGNSVCRASAGGCDSEERCDGVSPACPADSVLSTAVVCRAAVGVCDAEERCSGTAATCPADQLNPNTTVCRAAAGACDVPERCDGATAQCPADQLSPVTALCRGAADACDAEEHCTGTSSTCPGDAFQPPSTPCAALACSAGSFTFARFCSGTAISCPPPGTQMSCGGFQCASTSACGTACTNQSQCIASHFCQFGACALKQADGQSCTGANAGLECLSGVCTQTFTDADGDGFGAGGRSLFTCGAAAPVGRSLVSGDCCDSDARAKPGATAFEATARAGCGGFDFNCDGQETQGDTQGNACQPTACNVVCSGGGGWSSGVAACGVTASYVTACSSLPCTLGSPNLRCAPIIESRTQRCR